MTPLATASGMATITLTVNDGTNNTSTNFVLTVLPVNDAPTISGVADQSINEDATTGLLNFTVGDGETAPLAEGLLRHLEDRRRLAPLVLVELDQPCHALDHAVALARWFGAKVSVLHVHQLTTPTFAAGPYVGLEGLEPMSLTDVERGELLQAVNEFVAPDRAGSVTPGPVLPSPATTGAD